MQGGMRAGIDVCCEKYVQRLTSATKKCMPGFCFLRMVHTVRPLHYRPSKCAARTDWTPESQVFLAGLALGDPPGQGLQLQRSIDGQKIRRPVTCAEEVCYYRTFPGLEETSISWHLESRFLRLPDVVRNRCGIMSAFRITFDGIHSVCVQRLAKEIEMAQHCMNETHEISLQISLAGVADDS